MIYKCSRVHFRIEMYRDVDTGAILVVCDLRLFTPGHFVESIRVDRLVS